MYSCQTQLGRCLYNRNSLLNKLTPQGTDEQKEGVHNLMVQTANVAIQGAAAVGDMAEIQILESLRSMPFAYITKSFTLLWPTCELSAHSLQFIG